jgi:tetratricopeptide (TPR) repeat protein
MKIKDEITEATLHEVSKLIIEGNARIYTEDKGILLIGKTGAGKSTLTYLLAGQELKAILDRDTGNMIIDAVSPLENIRISHDATSGTQVPNKYMISGAAVWDCPGFNDTAGIPQEIANNFYLRRLFDTTAQLKFILAISEASLGNKALDFITIVDQFTKGFTDIQPLKNSVSLVVTHVHPAKEVKHIKTTIQKLIRQNTTIDASTAEMLQFLLKSVHIFKQPFEEGILSKCNIFKSINDSLEYVTRKDILANIPISSKAMVYADGLLDIAYINIHKIINIIVAAIGESNKGIKGDVESIFINSANNIRELIPASIQHIDWTPHYKLGAYFIEVDQTFALQTAFKTIKNNQDINAIADVFLKVLETFEEFATTERARHSVQEYSHVLKQQIEYIKFFSQLCKKSVLKQVDIELVVGACSVTIDIALIEKVKDLKLASDHKDIAYYEQAMKYFYLSPDDCIERKAEAYHHIGRLYNDKHNTNNALLNYIQSIKLNPSLYSAYDKIGELLCDKKDYRDALVYFKAVNNLTKTLSCFNELIKLNPTDLNLQVEKGNYCSSIGRYDKAIGCYQAAFSLTQDPVFKANMYRKIAGALQQKGELAGEYSARAEHNNFYNLKEIKTEDLDKKIMELTTAVANDSSREFSFSEQFTLTQEFTPLNISLADVPNQLQITGQVTMLGSETLE